MKITSDFTHCYKRAWTLKIAIASIFLVLAIPLSVGAQSNDAGADTAVQADESIWDRDKLTGDWWGLRSDDSKRGIDFDFRLSQYYQDVASGGINENGEYGGTMDYRVNVDAGKLFGAQGLSFNMHARTRFGQDVNADAGSFALQNTGMLLPSTGDYHGTDITGLTVSQFFPLSGKLIGVTVGKLDIVDLLAGFFPNSAYGQEGFWNANSMFTALPWLGALQGLSLYGGYAATINQEYGMAQSGFLFTGTENVATSWGSISDSFDDGVLLAGFHRFFWKMDDKPGYLMLIAGYSTKEQASNDPHDFVDIPGQGIQSTEQKNPWDIAFYAYQEFWQSEGDPNRKANFMIGGTAGPDNPQLAQWNLFANVEVLGLKDSRPNDRMGVSGWFNGLSSNFVDLVSPVTDLRDTWGFEFYYNFAINKWLFLSPDIQFIKNERVGDDLAIIPGIRLVMDF